MNNKECQTILVAAHTINSCAIK